MNEEGEFEACLRQHFTDDKSFLKKILMELRRTTNIPQNYKIATWSNEYIAEFLKNKLFWERISDCYPIGQIYFKFAHVADSVLREERKTVFMGLVHSLASDIASKKEHTNALASFLPELESEMVGIRGNEDAQILFIDKIITAYNPDIKPDLTGMDMIKLNHDFEMVLRTMKEKKVEKVEKVEEEEEELFSQCLSRMLTEEEIHRILTKINENSLARPFSDQEINFDIGTWSNEYITRILKIFSFWIYINQCFSKKYLENEDRSILISKFSPIVSDLFREKRKLIFLKLFHDTIENVVSSNDISLLQHPLLKRAVPALLDEIEYFGNMETIQPKQYIRQIIELYNADILPDLLRNDWLMLQSEFGKLLHYLDSLGFEKLSLYESLERAKPYSELMHPPEQQRKPFTQEEKAQREKWLEEPQHPENYLFAAKMRVLKDSTPNLKEKLAYRHSSIQQLVNPESIRRYINFDSKDGGGEGGGGGGGEPRYADDVENNTIAISEPFTHDIRIDYGNKLPTIFLVNTMHSSAAFSDEQTTTKGFFLRISHAEKMCTNLLETRHVKGIIQRNESLPYMLKAKYDEKKKQGSHPDMKMLQDVVKETLCIRNYTKENAYQRVFRPSGHLKSPESGRINAEDIDFITSKHSGCDLYFLGTGEKYKNKMYGLSNGKQGAKEDGIFVIAGFANMLPRPLRGLMSIFANDTVSNENRFKTNIFDMDFPIDAFCASLNQIKSGLGDKLHNWRRAKGMAIKDIIDLFTEAGFGNIIMDDHSCDTLLRYEDKYTPLLESMIREAKDELPFYKGGKRRRTRKQKKTRKKNIRNSRNFRKKKLQK